MSWRRGGEELGLGWQGSVLKEAGQRHTKDPEEGTASLGTGSSGLSCLLALPLHFRRRRR